jgi:chromosome segregation ATPase
MADPKWMGRIAELEAEVERLKALLEKICDGTADLIKHLRAEVELLQAKLQTIENMAHGALLYEKNAEIEGLRAIIKAHAGHDPTCPAAAGEADCDCGFAAALGTAESKRTRYRGSSRIIGVG